MEKGSNVDGDESGGTSPSRQGAGTGIQSPQNLMAMAAEIGIASREKGSGIRVSSAGVKIGPKGGTRGPEGSQEGARRGLGWGRARDPSESLWWPSLPSLVIPEASGTLIFYIIFRNFWST